MSDENQNPDSEITQDAEPEASGHRGTHTLIVTGFLAGSVSTGTATVKGATVRLGGWPLEGSGETSA